MKKLILTASLVGLMIMPTFGAKVLQKGDSAPYTGVLFDMKEEKKIRQIRMEHIQIKELNALQLEKLLIQSKRIKILRTHIESNKSIWGKIGYFTLGIIATSAALYGGVQLSRTLGR